MEDTTGITSLPIISRGLISWSLRMLNIRWCTLSEDLVYLRELIETEKIPSVIDRRYPLEQIAEIHAYVQTGYIVGNVVITLDNT